MNKSVGVKGALALCLLQIVDRSCAANSALPIRVNNYVIPAVFASALQQGMTVPVFIRYEGETSTNRSQQKIADAILSVRDRAFLINQVTLSNLPDRTELAPQIKMLIENLKNARFSDGNHLNLNKDATITLVPRSFYLELMVNKNAMTAAILPRSNMLGNSSANHASNIINYTVGSYYNKYNNNNNASNYITLDNTTSLREHHLNINSSIYGIGTINSNGEIYRAMYEHDYQGNRMALGMVDTWNLQSIASMSSLNSSRIYGASYGNKSSTIIEDNTLTLVPITVFLPTAGEVHIIRAGKLLSIQNFSMGSYEIDTSKLPFGVYTVDVEVIANGKVVNSRTAQINKTFTRKSSVTGNLAWQTFAGMLEYNEMDYRRHNTVNRGKKETWITGAAMSIAQPWLSGVTLKSTLYGFDNNCVNETEANIVFNDTFNFNQQTLLGRDGSWQSISSLNLSIPGGYGNLWGSRQFSYISNRLPMQKGDYFSVGANTNLNSFIPWSGNLSVSRTDNKYSGNKYTNVDYSQPLFSSNLGAVSLRAGIQRYYYYDRHNHSDKYVNIDFSFPLSTWLRAGVSSENGNMRANSTLHKSFDDSAITQVGASLSKRIRNSDNNKGYRYEDFAANSYISYDAKYNAGTVTITRSSDHSTNHSLSLQGSIGWTKESFNLGKGTQSAGVVINTGFTEKGRMLAQINARNYPLTGKSNFISLPPYAEYKIELMNDKTSQDSVDIITGRSNQIVLYPGNISVISPEVKQLVTVFGRVRKPDGAIYTNIDIHYHIGKTRTDERGEFAMDVDKRYPMIYLNDDYGGICKADLDLRDARGAVWIGDIQCVPQSQTGGKGYVY